MMPSEPDKKMDELLRTYARKRREDAGEPAEMHPVTRRLLQAEAAKLRPQEAKPHRTPWSWGWLFARWPRVAFAVGVFALLAVAIWNGVPHRGQSSSPTLLAKQDEESKEMSQTRALGRDQTAAPQTQVGDRLEQDKDAADRFRAVLKSEPARSLDESQVSAENSPSGPPALADTKRKQESATLGMRLQAAAAPADGLKLAEAEGAAGASENKAMLRKLEVGSAVRQVATGQEANRLAPSATTAPASDDNVALKAGSDPRAVGVTYSAPATPAAAESYYRLPQVTRAGPVTNAVLLQDNPGAKGLIAERGATSLNRLPAPAAPAPNTPASVASATSGNETKARVDAFAAEKRDISAGVPLADFSQTRARATGAAPGAMLAAAEKTQPPTQPKQSYRFQRDAESEKLVAAKPANESAPDSVLLNFEIEQDGDRVRVIDSDGSVYAGRFVTGAELGQARFAELGAELGRSASAGVGQRRQSNATDTARRYFTTAGTGPAMTNRLFRVNGINRTFGQLVTMEALLPGGPEKLIADEARGASLPGKTAPPSVRPPAEPAKNPGAAPSRATAAASETLESQRLVGRLRIGAFEEVKLIAVPVAK